MITENGVVIISRTWPEIATSVSAGRVAFAEHGIGRTMIRLCGEHDISTVDALSEVVERAMSLDDADVELDLSDVQYMSAATIGVIVRTREWLQERDRLLVLRSPSSIARRLCDLCGLAYLGGLDPVVAAAGVMPAVVVGEAVDAGHGGT
jgi:anti-anti-sigma factor